MLCSIYSRNFKLVFSIHWNIRTLTFWVCGYQDFLLAYGYQFCTVLLWRNYATLTWLCQCCNLCRYTVEDLDRIHLAYSWSLPYVRILLVALTLLTLLWELMLLATVLYFHNMPQKLTGAAFAAIGWFLAYRVWYLPSVTKFTVWSPGLPGRGIIRYQKESSWLNVLLISTSSFIPCEVVCLHWFGGCSLSANN